MELYTIELVSIASAQLFKDNTLSSSTKLLRQQLIPQSYWENAISKISYASMYQRGKIPCFFEKIFLNSSDFYYLELGLYSSITDIVEAMKTFIRERHNHSESSSTVKVSRRAQEVEIYFANEGSVLNFFSKDFGYIFGSKVGKELGVMLRKGRAQKPKIHYDIVQVLSLLINTDLIEYNIVGNTKASLWPCFLFLSKLDAADI